jgi:osmotically-inducible protein OsmY
MKALRSSFAILAAVSSCVLSGCSLPAVYAKCGLSGCPGDTQITVKVQELLDHQAGVFLSDISVQTLDHVVYLRGLVDTNVQREEIIAAARSVPGVDNVVESIVIRNDPGF